jgi:uncharacterized protein (UPF0335 family)
MLTQQEEKQLEFKDVSPRTPLGEKIVAYLEAKHQVENKKTVLEKAPKEVIKKIKSLKNFDAKKFKEITGLDVRGKK